MSTDTRPVPVILYCGRTNKCGVEGNTIAKNIRQFTRGLQLDGQTPAFAIVNFERQPPTAIEAEWVDNDVVNSVQQNGFVFVVGRPPEDYPDYQNPWSEDE